jgi:hypothetical protein
VTFSDGQVREMRRNPHRKSPKELSW